MLVFRRCSEPLIKLLLCNGHGRLTVPLLDLEGKSAISGNEQTASLRPGHHKAKSPDTSVSFELVLTVGKHITA